MRELAYVFERFPSYLQTFCYREVGELQRQGAALTIFSIRQPENEPLPEGDRQLVENVRYLPQEKELIEDVGLRLRKGRLPQEVAREIEDWGRRTDFLRLYQAAYIGMRLQERGLRHLHAHFAGLAARTAFWIKRFFGIDYSFTAHANDIFAPRPFAIGLDQLIGAAQAVVTETDYAARFLKERFPADAKKILRIYNGLDLSRFRAATFEATPPVIISVGRLIEKKGFPDLIEACQMLKARGRDFRCEIIGEGVLEAPLRAQIESGDLQSRVKLIGRQSQQQIIQRLAAATVFVLPCRTEQTGGTDNLPTSIMEAMAAGLPVISTPIAGVPEMLEHEVTGELVSPADPSALAAAIERFIIDPERARRFGARGLEVAREKFPIQKSARALIALFEKIAGERRA